MNVFLNTSLHLTILSFIGHNFTKIHGFGMYSSCNATYYVMDYGANKVYILNDDWLFISFKSFTQPAFMITVGSCLYMTGASNIWKLDKDLNVLNQITGNYRGIFSNSSLIYVAPQNFMEIHVFDLNLTLSHKINISTYIPWSITEYNNQLFVGTSSGTILVLVNETIIKTFNGCSSGRVCYILFDQFGYMTTLCGTTRTLYLYYSNGTYAGRTKPANGYPAFQDFDSKCRFALISENQISIYN